MDPKQPASADRWLNGNVIGLAVNRFLSDLGHEAGTSVLPLFLAATGRPPRRSAGLKASPTRSQASRSSSAGTSVTGSSAASPGLPAATFLPA